VAEAAFVQSPRATINDNTMRVSREREGEGKRRGTKLLLPLLSVLGKKKHSVVQNNTILRFFF
jgi:hypothetical protein